MRSDRHAIRRPLATTLALACLLGALLAGPAAAKKKGTDAREEALPAKYQQWLEEVDVLISEEERESFLALTQDYHRDEFIERFWRVRDPYPDTARNEFRDRYEERVDRVRTTYGSLTEARPRTILLNGEPAAIRELECSNLLWPTEVWFYAGTERTSAEFFIVFFKRWGAGPYRLWEPGDGLRELFQSPSPTDTVSTLLSAIRFNCFRGDEIAAILGSILTQGVLGYAWVIEEVTQKPEPPTGEWVATFEAYSTDLPEGAQLLEAELDLSFPGRRQSRTIVQGVLRVAPEAAGRAELADYRSYNFVLTGEVLAGDELFDSFRYKFDFPAAEVTGIGIPMVFQRYLRPGDYRLVLKLEDLNGKRYFRADRALAVPQVAAAPPPPPDPETARLLEEANRTLATGEVTLQLVEPTGQLITGYRRIDTLVTGEGIDRVTFTLDGKPLLTKKRPPFSVELDLGDLPRTRTLEAVAYDAAGNQLASDEVLLNASSHRFGVRLVEPHRGATYKGSLRARAEVQVPEGRAVERVEFFLNESRVATLYQAPYVQPIVLPAGGEIAYVQAVAYLPDGNSTQDLVFINAPDLSEAIEIQYVELYTTVLDRGGHPVSGLGRQDFTVREDGVEQEIRRFETVADRPIYAAVLMDISASMEDRLEQTRDAALSFFQQILQPKDRAAVITFNDRPNLVVKFTNEVSSLAGGLAGLKAERGTALYDSLIFGLYYFNGIKGQRALLVLSDGKDESSRFEYDDALEYARRAGVTVYAIGLDLPRNEARRKLAQLAEETGGRSFFIDGTAELAGVYATIEEELRSQYLIAYQSSNTAEGGDFRSIEVEVARPGLEAKTLRGYYP